MAKKIVPQPRPAARNSWRAVADVSDKIADLVEGIPGWECEFAVETRRELKGAAALLRRAIPLLRRASKREEAKGVTSHG
jgi:hypothetical protein